MSKGNLFLGMARGSVGDVTFTRANGQQIARARNRSPRNPQTVLQQAQRVIMSTNVSAYSLMREICDHSFEGVEGAAKNQQRFLSRNNTMLRDRVATYLNTSDAEIIRNAQAWNYAAKGSVYTELNPYILSEGTLSLTFPGMILSDGAAYLRLASPANVEEPTYEDIADMLGLSQGDQLTICWITGPTTTSQGDIDRAIALGVAGKIYSFNYARIILDPQDGDMSHKFGIGGTYSSQVNNVRDLNVEALEIEGNRVDESSVNFYITSPPSHLELPIDEGVVDIDIVGWALIASRWNGSKWLRSSSAIQIPHPISLAWGIDYLGDAIRSWDSVTNSSLYLNQGNT